MRDTEARGWMVQNSSNAATPALRFKIVASTIILGIAVAMTGGAARAADDDEKGFSEKVIDSIKTTIRGGGNIDDGRIQYRERSPLVVPSGLDLPPPDKAPAAEAKAPNWPKDPDEGRRRASAKKKKDEPGAFDSYFSSFLPTKPAAVAAAPEEPQGPPPPARPDNFTDRDNPVYDRAGNLWGGVGSFFGSSKTEVGQFTGEPTRNSLTQPPAGYQTPSPNFAYGKNIKVEVPRPVETNSAGERVR